ncbi:chain length determinant protein tyrosine kinase EpsG [Noviherbaspirillum aridicola]|uniref:Chain length determinant protein tyrosine kinase EpsG n=1 Tax=Noviherbaspirillum aridicola TaxID=2849687 RepID=A0ABQ4Q6S1_9BURK|nr:chain length determinant protein tyrosine kinase EpsG [Noviherbaspirillum aridicola]GIZ52505.1 hypothetical protein NCCP691_25190 [Noviherbaspirillum aridicola]
MDHVIEERPASRQATRDTSIGRILLEQGKITPEDAERVLRAQKELGMRFGEAAKHLGLVTESDIQQVLSQQFAYPYLLPGQGGFSNELVAAYNPFSPQVDTFRAVRSQLMLRWFGAGRKALAIAAVHPGDGASYCAANLAVVFSQLGEKTLLVDANLRAGRQQALFNLNSRTGLSDVLGDRSDLDAIAPVAAFESLSVLGAGTPPPNPHELISRPAFPALTREVSAHFDVVLFDVPAFASGPAALSVAAAVGGVLLVVRRNQTRWSEVATASQQIRSAGAELVGTVLVDR